MLRGPVVWCILASFCPRHTSFAEWGQNKEHIQNKFGATLFSAIIPAEASGTFFILRVQLGWLDVLYG